MKIVIIEDELIVAEDLATSLKEINPSVEISAILGSVKEAVDYFNNNSEPDLIFSDIQLGDGLCFEIAKTITPTVPVIFCTAFDEYALDAFKANGIEYILKPFSRKSLADALLKFENMQKFMAGSITQRYEDALAAITAINKNASTTIMVRYRERLLPIALDKIAFFCMENDVVYLYTHLGKSYAMSESLEELENKMGQNFFRVNRQYLVNRNAILEATDYFPRKLKINLVISTEKEIIVSREKKSKILAWLEGK